MRKKLAILVGLLLAAAASLRGDVAPRMLVLPSAASVQGLVPFFSDVRVFNTSYTGSVTVTMTYRCYIASCPASAPQVALTLSPRESRALDDMVLNTFAALNSAGGVEFGWTGESEQLVVTSRLYSTEPAATVGMFIPGLGLSEAYPDTVLTSVRNGGSGAGFRTNAGVFNPGDTSVTVTFNLFDGSTSVGNPVPVTVAAHSGVQISPIFRAAGVETLPTGNGVIAVHASAPVFSFAAVIDNATSDPYLVIGAEDGPAPVAATRTVHVGQGGNLFVDEVSGNGTSTINVGDTVVWVWEGSLNHGSDAGTCSGGGGPYGEPTCTANGIWASGVYMSPHSWSRTFTEAGTFPYFCDVHQGSMTGRVVVNAPAALQRSTASRR